MYLEAALATIGLALFRDPFFDTTCWANCADNVFLVRSVPVLARTVETADQWFTASAAAALLAVCAWRLLTRRGPARMMLLPVALPAMVFAAATSAHAIALHQTPIEDPGIPAFMVIFEVQNAAVILLAAPLLAAGHPVAEPAAAPGRLVTGLVQQDTRVAAVSHAATLPELERELGASIRLGLENERLQAEVLFQLSELRASRARIVETGDAERRRLERNLHDGAQQRLLALSYDIRLAHASADADSDDQARFLLAQALAGVRPASVSSGSLPTASTRPS